MYLRLGNSLIKYNIKAREDFMVIAQIVNSTMGFESPVLVHSEDELTIWFGDNFEGRDWLVELLNSSSDLSLLLSSPISTIQQEIEGSDYINYTSFPVINSWEEFWESVKDIDDYKYISKDKINIFLGDIDIFPDPLNLSLEAIETYEKLYGSLGPDAREEKRKEFESEFKQSLENKLFKLTLNPAEGTFEDYIWTGEFYTATSFLPQNINPEGSESFLRRDTLQLGWQGEDKINKCWSYPKFKDIQEEVSLLSSETIDWGKIDESKIDQELDTLAFNITWPQNFSIDPENPEDIKYFIIGDTIYYCVENLDTETTPPIVNGDKGRYYYSKKVPITNLEEFKTGLKEDGWFIEEDLIYRYSQVPITYFYKWNNENLSLESNFEKTQEILTSGFSPIITFWSKTLGRPKPEEWEEDNIHIHIEKVPDSEDLWRATISRYDFIEVFEGSLSPSPSRLDHIIDKNSKLVHARIPDELATSLDKLPEGNYQLRGGKILERSNNLREDMNYTMSWMLMREWFIDYFLIPDPSEFMDENNHEDIYKNWLLYSTYYSFQYLIQNNQENIDWNYTKDQDNRLVWFWGDMIVFREQRPGYYLFLLGSIQNIYSMTAQKIIYNCPNPYPYEQENNNLENLLKEHKSNYLVCNNQIYYYKEYQNGYPYNSTIWMRFVMGKINRELKKRMEIYLGSHSVGEILSAVNGILSTIEKRFDIIRSINVQYSNIDWNEQRAIFILNTSISDLKENNMTLDVNINYNKN